MLLKNGRLFFIQNLMISNNTIHVKYIPQVQITMQKHLRFYICCTSYVSTLSNRIKNDRK